MNLGIGNAVGNIDEATVFCRELLSSNTPQQILINTIEALLSVHDLNFLRSSPPEISEKVIECLRETNRRLDSRRFTFKLAAYLFYRFEATNSMDDYEEAKSLFDKIISECNGDDQREYMNVVMDFSAALAWKRFNVDKSLESLEEAIHRYRTMLRGPSIKYIRRVAATEVYAIALEIRSNVFGVTEGLQEARSWKAELEYSPSFSDLFSSFLQFTRSTTDKTRWWTDLKPDEEAQYLVPLTYVCRTTDIAEIQEAIKYCRLLASGPPNALPTCRATRSLGEVLFHAFKCTDKIEYLNESITTFRNCLQMPVERDGHFIVTKKLLTALYTRMTLSMNWKDSDEAIQLYSVVCKDPHTSVRDKFKMSCDWAYHARRLGHHIDTIPVAYETAVSLLEDALLTAPTLETQHFHLVMLRFEDFPRDIASYEVGSGQLKEAIRALERGRGIIWSEIRGLRTSLDQLPVDSHLAEEFTTVNKELETLTMAVSPGMEKNDEDELEDGEEKSEFSRLVV